MQINYPQNGDYFPLSVPQRTGEQDYYYAVLGRALTLATLFEANLKFVLSFIKATPTINIETIENEKLLLELSKVLSVDLSKRFEKIMKINEENINNLIGILKAELGITDKDIEFLHLARKARNFLAHDIALNLDHKLKTEQGKERFLILVKEETNKIAVANWFLSKLHLKRTVGIQPSEKGMEEYIQSINAWIYELVPQEGEMALNR